MKRGQKIWKADTRTLRQLKLCSILLVLYFAAILIYILAIKDSNKENVKQFSNKVVNKVFLLLVILFSAHQTINIYQ
jgi:succinate dehydrogenase hydrophobic anchor subunit